MNDVFKAVFSIAGVRAAPPKLAAVVEIKHTGKENWVVSKYCMALKPKEHLNKSHPLKKI